MPRGVYIRTPEYRAKLSAAAMGRPCSAETRAKIGKANRKLRGYKHSAQARANMSKAQKLKWEKLSEDKEFMDRWNARKSAALKGKYTGALGANWRGGVTQNRRESNQNWAWRDAVLLRDNYTCQACDQYGGDLHADHLKPWSKYPELRFEATNGRTLCRACHYYISFKKKLPSNSRWALPRRRQNHRYRDLA